MKIKVEYDVETTSRYDYEPSFRTVKKVYNVDEIDAEDYINEKYSDLEDEEFQEMLNDFDYADKDFLEWVDERQETYYENELFNRED